jgi:hypothetical protein
VQLVGQNRKAGETGVDRPVAEPGHAVEAGAVTAGEQVSRPALRSGLKRGREPGQASLTATVGLSARFVEMRAIPGGSKEAVNEPRGPARRTARHAKDFHHGRWCDSPGRDNGDDPTEMSERHLGAATASDVVGESLEPRRGVTTETVERPGQPARHPSGIAPVAGVAQLPRHDHLGLPARPARSRRP